ncbi:MAG: S41 family peptidase [Planctomycetota bacterium]
MSRNLHVIASTLLATAAATPLAAQSKLLRHPDLFGDRVVFTYAGDLWQAPLTGGTATRLTSADGVELYAKYSPDGRWIAFTGQVSGDEQVFVVPSDGGELQQLTWYPARGPLPARWGHDHQVYDWTPDGTRVLFRSLREAWTMTGGKLYTVAMPTAAQQFGALPVALPMPQAGAGAYSPDGEKLVYAPLFRDFRTWKRYEGGWAQDLWVFDFQSGRAENITNHPRTDRDPMWFGDRVWFASDRSGTLNLWSYDFATKAVYQETSSTNWDVRWPSAGGRNDNRIVYEKGGELFWLDCKTREEHAIPIRVPDEGLLTRRRPVDAKGLIEDYDLAPGGGRAAIAARGELFTVPKQHGDTRNLSNTPGAHEKHASFSPDGATIAYVSDQTGEEQIWLVDHKGATPPRQLTKELRVMLYTPQWSPDGKWLAIDDKDGVLRVCNVATGELIQVADEPHGQLHDYAWSPCSGWLVLAMTGANDLSAIHLWSLAERKLQRVSRDLSNDRQPRFDRRGERLFFVGLRGYAPRLPSEYEWDFQVDRADGIFALALRKDVAPLFPQRSDEAVQAEEPKVEPPSFAQPITIDFDGLADRVEQLPVGFDNFNGLACADGHLLYSIGGGGFYGRGPDRPTTLHAFSFAERKHEQLASGVSGYSLSPDGTHVLIRTGGSFAITKAALSGKDGQLQLDLSGLVADKVAGAEYRQIFEEVWRRYRDFFYVANLHGHDWQALHDKYAPLVQHVRHRSDLNYVIGEMIAELNVGHAYITGGDLGEPERPQGALPGLLLQVDKQDSRYRIARLLQGQNDDPKYRSPANAVGVSLKVGEYVLAIDGVELKSDVNPYRVLAGKAGRSVRLLVNQTAAKDDAREVVLEPIDTEEHLHYLAWTERNRQKVAELSDGKLGYLHLPDMGPDGLREFIRQYYPQRDKQGLVIDDRYNGGGNVSRMVLNRLGRKLTMATFGRTSGFRPYPDALFLGHLACLLNETSASDGDIFPAMFRRMNLGPLIGKRSWGGIIGITNRGMLMDGGTVNVPEFGNTEPGPEWTIEGRGVTPDIEVDNDVFSLLQGKDPQLEKAIEVLLDKIKKDPRPVPVAPPAPIKTGR